MTLKVGLSTLLIYAIGIFVLLFDADSTLQITAPTYITTVATWVGNLLWVYGTVLCVITVSLGAMLWAKPDWKLSFAKATEKGKTIKPNKAPSAFFAAINFTIGVALMGAGYWWTGTWWAAGTVVANMFWNHYKRCAQEFLDEIAKQETSA